MAREELKCFPLRLITARLAAKGLPEAVGAH
jgi:hypothetical protein